MFATHDMDFHSRMKRSTGQFYSTPAITELEPLVNKNVHLFLAQLRRSAAGAEPLNIDNWLQFYSFDCLSALSFSENVGCLSNGTDVEGMLHTVDWLFDYVALVSLLMISSLALRI